MTEPQLVVGVDMSDKARAALVTALQLAHRLRCESLSWTPGPLGSVSQAVLAHATSPVLVPHHR